MGGGLQTHSSCTYMNRSPHWARESAKTWQSPMLSSTSWDQHSWMPRHKRTQLGESQGTLSHVVSKDSAPRGTPCRICGSGYEQRPRPPTLQFQGTKSSNLLEYPRIQSQGALQVRATATTNRLQFQGTKIAHPQDPQGGSRDSQGSSRDSQGGPAKQHDRNVT